MRVQKHLQLGLGRRAAPEFSCSLLISVVSRPRSATGQNDSTLAGSDTQHRTAQRLDLAFFFPSFLLFLLSFSFLSLSSFLLFLSLLLSYLSLPLPLSHLPFPFPVLRLSLRVNSQSRHEPITASRTGAGPARPARRGLVVRAAFFRLVVLLGCLDRVSAEQGTGRRQPPRGTP